MQKLLIRYYLKKYIHLTPIIMLVITLISNFIDVNYVVVGNLMGYSILSNFLMWYFFNFTGSYCWFTRKSSLGLILINIIDILGSFINYSYYSKIFNVTICLVALFLFIYHKLKKKENDTFYYSRKRSYRRAD